MIVIGVGVRVLRRTYSWIACCAGQAHENSLTACMLCLVGLCNCGPVAVSTVMTGPGVSWGSHLGEALASGPEGVQQPGGVLGATLSVLWMSTATRGSFIAVYSRTRARYATGSVRQRN
jgi:hypothetical protein